MKKIVIPVVAFVISGLAVTPAMAAEQSVPSAKWPKPPSNTKVTFRFGLTRDDVGAIEKLKDVSSPSSANFRDWLSEASINSAYGATAATKKAARSWFKQHGFTAKVDPTGVFLEATGTAVKWASVFGARLTMSANDTAYDLAGTSIFARKAPTLPAGLTGLVTEAVWYDVTSQKIKGALAGAPAPAPKLSDPVPGAPQNLGTFGKSCPKAEQGKQAYAFNQFATAYGLTSLPDSSVGILTFGEGVANRSLRAAERCWGWPTKQVRYNLTDGQSKKPGLHLSGFSEPQLDVQVIRGLMSNATVVNYQGFVNFDLWFNVLAEAYNDPQHPNVLSISYGECELYIAKNDQARTLFDAIALRLGLTGTTVLTASGDSGAASCAATTSVAYPASSPYVTTVGGTRLVVDAQNQRASEVAWNDYAWLADGEGGGASGGGVSSYYAKPWWQANVAEDYTMRALPDIAAHASMFPAWPVIYKVKSANGSWKRQYDLVAGTSASAPLVAAMVAGANVARSDGKPLGFLNPYLYAAGKSDADAFFDITSGNNAVAGASAGYQAGPGYDLVTGWGVPMFGTFTR